MDRTIDKYQTAFVYLVLATITFAVFWQVHSFEFTNYDDPLYVSHNDHILSGLKWSNVKWVFTSEHSANWHPLTGLSHILDCQLFDANAGRHHLVNLLFHIANTLLLFTVLRRMTGLLWQSAFVAALFAIHPLHVESVAWISERKDVLSTFFWFLTMSAYFHYVQNPKVGRYILTLVLFVLGLMAKPMLVTLPFTLLLLDYWPLERLTRKTFYHRLSEKIPFFILSAVSSVVTFLVQRSAGAVKEITVVPLAARMSNAVVAYVKYIARMIWPSHLAAFYPHPVNTLSWFQVAAAAVLLLIITIMVIRLGGKYKYMPVGWLWYLGTLVPVIGLVQVGGQAMADRYTYVPLIGLFITIAWGASDLLTGWKYRKITLSLSSLVIISALSVCAWIQTGYWRNSVGLFEHALKVTGEKNYLACENLGVALSEQHRYDEAITLFHRALELQPYYVQAHVDLGMALFYKGKLDDAINHWNLAMQINPNLIQPYINLSMTYCKLGRWQDVMEITDKAMKLNPALAAPYNDRGAACASLGRSQEAIQNFEQAIKNEPARIEAYDNLGTLFDQLGRYQEASEIYMRMVKIEPNSVETYNKLGGELGRLGQYKKAIDAINTAIKINPAYSQAYYNLAASYDRLGKFDDAIRAFKQAIKITPNDSKSHFGLGAVYLKSGDKDSAIAEYEILKTLDPQKAKMLSDAINK